MKADLKEHFIEFMFSLVSISFVDFHICVFHGSSSIDSFLTATTWIIVLIFRNFAFNFIPFDYCYNDLA